MTDVHTPDCTDCGCDENCTAPLPSEAHEHQKVCYATGCPEIRQARERAQSEEAEALRRVITLHKPYGIYDECGHDHAEEDEGVVVVDDVGFVCDDGLMYQVCQHCCVTGKHFYDYQTEECVSAHKHGKDMPLCATLAAIAGVPS